MKSKLASQLQASLKSPGLWAAFIFAFALALRLFGIGWGMSKDSGYFTYHPDEPWNYMVMQRLDPLQGKLTPNFYNYGTLYLSVSRIAQSPIRHLDLAGSNDHIAKSTLVGRIISALAGAATAWLVFLILLPRTNLLGAVAGGLAMAVSPGHLIHSRFMTVDVFAAFLATASLYFALRLLPSRGEEPQEFTRKLLGVPAEILWAGLFAGLSAGTKYTGGLVLLALIIVLCFRPRPERFMGIALAIGSTLIAFVIATPGVILEPIEFRRDFMFEMLHAAQGHGLVFAATAPTPLYHLANLFEGFGLVLTLLGLAGLIGAAMRRHAWAWPALAFLVVTFLLISRAEVKFFRYVIPLIPLLAIGAGWLVGQAHINPDRRWRLLSGMGLLFLGGMFGKSLVLSMFMAGSDPRDEAATYLKSKGRVTVGIVSDAWFQTPPLFPSTALPRAVSFDERRVRQAYEEENLPTKTIQYIPKNPDERFDWDVRLLDLAPDYVVASSFEVDDYVRIQNAVSSGRFQPEPIIKLQLDRWNTFMKRLEKEYTLDRMFGENGPTIHDLMYIRPRIWIWKRKPDLPKTSTPSSTTSGSSEGQAPTP